jgi:hypothetical protein
MRKISTCKLCLVRTAGCRYGEPDQDYETDSNANKKSSKVELEEWIDGDYENQVKEHLEATRGPMRAWMWL